LVLQITLTKAVLRPAVLTLARKDGTIVVTRSLCDHFSSWAGTRLEWCRSGDKPQEQLSTTAWDKNGLSGVNGLSARLEQMSTTSNHNLDSNRNLTFFVDSREVPGFDAAPDDNATDRDIKPGTQRSLGIQAHDLLPGEYHATTAVSGCQLGRR
jgi:hypothetical protein